jgi:hypothetical protein
LKNSRTATCSSPERMAGRNGPPGVNQNVDRSRGAIVAGARTDLAQAIGVKCVGQEYADADENEERRHDLGHSLPPCVAMPERARLRNPR